MEFDFKDFKLMAGRWWIRCPSDPRWDAEGRGMVGGGLALDEVCQLFQAKRTELGMEPPEDCEWGYEKD